MRMAYASTRKGDVGLVARLVLEYPDGWALSCPASALRTLLPVCPEGVRVLAWVRPSGDWEPLLVCGGRPSPRALTHDWTNVAGNARGRPEEFFHWVFRVLNLQPDDDFQPIPLRGGVVAHAWALYRRQLPLPDWATTEQMTLDL